VIGHNLGYFFDVIRVENFHADGEVAAEIDHGAQDVHGTGVPVDDGALRVILFEQVENFFLAGFGVQVDEFLLLGGGRNEIFQDSFLCRIEAGVFYPVKVEAAASRVYIS